MIAKFVWLVSGFYAFFAVNADDLARYFSFGDNNLKVRIFDEWAVCREMLCTRITKAGWNMFLGWDWPHLNTSSDFVNWVYDVVRNHSRKNKIQQCLSSWAVPGVTSSTSTYYGPFWMRASLNKYFNECNTPLPSRIKSAWWNLFRGWGALNSFLTTWTSFRDEMLANKVTRFTDAFVNLVCSSWLCVHQNSERSEEWLSQPRTHVTQSPCRWKWYEHISRPGTNNQSVGMHPVSTVS